MWDGSCCRWAWGGCGWLPGWGAFGGGLCLPVRVGLGLPGLGTGLGLGWPLLGLLLVGLGLAVVTGGSVGGPSGLASRGRASLCLEDTTSPSRVRSSGVGGAGPTGPPGWARPSRRPALTRRSCRRAGSMSSVLARGQHPKKGRSLQGDDVLAALASCRVPADGASESARAGGPPDGADEGGGIVVVEPSGGGESAASRPAARRVSSLKGPRVARSGVKPSGCSDLAGERGATASSCVSQGGLSADAQPPSGTTGPVSAGGPQVCGSSRAWRAAGGKDGSPSQAEARGDEATGGACGTTSRAAPEDEGVRSGGGGGVVTGGGGGGPSCTAEAQESTAERRARLVQRLLRAARGGPPEAELGQAHASGLHGGSAEPVGARGVPPCRPTAAPLEGEGRSGARADC